LLARAGQQLGQGGQQAGGARATGGHSGRWVRQGRKIVIYGA
jgi:hypothetical protein